MAKRIYFGTNLKMYKGIEATVSYLEKLTELTADLSNKEINLFVIPSYTSLADAVKIKGRDKVYLGAQNMCWEDEGQFSGEISPLMLKELALDMVMIGHSERRHIFKESNSDENKKVIAALKHDFTALLCVGETEEEKEAGISNEVLRTQIIAGLCGVKAEAIGDKQNSMAKLIIAYEPVWAIGVNGKPASASYAAEKHLVIRNCLNELFGEDLGMQIPILYGGSVNPQNAPELIIQKEIDGLFIGRSAWEAEKFNKLIRDSLKSLKNR